MASQKLTARTFVLTFQLKSSKQKLNTKSSTELELVGFSDYVPYTIWIRNFLEAQGYKLKKNVVFQEITF